MPIRAITFDFWCTLFRDANGPPRQQIRAEALATAAGVTLERARRALAPVNQRFYAHHVEHQRTLTPMDAVQMVSEELGVTLEPRAAEDLAHAFATAILEHSPIPVTGAFEAVQTAARHLPTGVISDSGLSPGDSLRQLLDRHGFLEHLNPVVFSDEAGVAKPHRAIFEHTARQMGVAPDELLHIGDLEHTDIAGAQAFGAKAILFIGANASFASTTRADYIFEDWSSFTEVLPQLLHQA